MGEHHELPSDRHEKLVKRPFVAPADQVASFERCFFHTAAKLLEELAERLSTLTCARSSSGGSCSRATSPT